MYTKITRIRNIKEKRCLKSNNYRKISYSRNVYSSVEDKFKKLTKNTN